MVTTITGTSRRAAGVQLAEEVPRVLVLEQDVEHDRHGTHRAQPLARLAQRARGQHLEARALQVLLVDEQRLAVVLDHQHRQAGRRRAGGSPRARTTPRSRPFVVHGDAPRRTWTRGRARSRRSTLPPSSAASLRDSGRPRPVPAHPALQRVLDLRELLEDALLVLGRDADAGVARRENDHRARPTPARAETRTSPRSVNLSALEMKLRRICETFASSVCSGGRPSRVLEDQRRPTRSTQQRPQHAAQRAEQVARRRTRPAGPRSCRPRPWRGRAGRSPARPGLSADLLDEADLLLLLGGQLAVDALEQQPRRAPGSSSAACGTRGSCSRGSATSSRRRGAGGRPARRARRRARRRRGWCPRARG